MSFNKWKIPGIILLIFVWVQVSSQDRERAKQTIDALTSSEFWGRGYTKHGMQKAADYLVAEFRLMGLKPLAEESFYQYFAFPVNTFPGKMKVNIDGRDLVPGKDFIISPESRGIKADAVLVKRDSITYNTPDGSLIISLQNKLTWSVASEAENYTHIQVRKDALPWIPQKIKATVDNEEIANFRAANICALVPGSRRPDSVILITAHYDHLGGMGKSVYFPGANDNASGIALLLDLARYYKANPHPYSIGFICFSGEEAGLLGSKYFTEHPLTDLTKVRFLINLDLTGTGEEGITVVNGSVFERELALIRDLNERNNYVKKVNSRGKAANSDHYWFSQKGVPSFFIYTMGGIKAYHDIYDIAPTLPLISYNSLFKLIRDFNSEVIALKR